MVVRTKTETASSASSPAKASTAARTSVPIPRPRWRCPSHEPVLTTRVMARSRAPMLLPNHDAGVKHGQVE